MERACQEFFIKLSSAAALLNGGSGRCASIAHLAAFKMEQPFERQLTCEDELPLLAGRRPVRATQCDPKQKFISPKSSRPI